MVDFFSIFRSENGILQIYPGSKTRSTFYQINGTVKVCTKSFVFKAIVTRGTAVVVFLKEVLLLVNEAESL